MGCTNCSSKENSTPNGCKSNGNCASGSCSSFTVFDWLTHMRLPNNPLDNVYVEVSFKNGRKEYFKNTDKLSLNKGSMVTTEVTSGHDVGMISLIGHLVEIQMDKRNITSQKSKLSKIYRIATDRDLSVWRDAKDSEIQMLKETKELIKSHRLEMKISDVEIQGDGTKAMVYYTADKRVDFRDLIKAMSSKFSLRIELKQIGVRNEAAKIGGIGSCGRELCCSTWMSEFKTVTTNAARYQDLSLNPQKLEGQCGKLKCCLNYELDTYTEILKEFPKRNALLHTKKGKARCQKKDIFKRILWYSYQDDASQWYELSLENVQKIIAKNEKKEPVNSLEEYQNKDKLGANRERKNDFIVTDMNNDMNSDSLTRFDEKKRNSRKNNRNRNKKRKNNA